MTLRTKIASAILFVVVATSEYWCKGIALHPAIVNCGFAIGISLGILTLFVTDISIWLKLFLVGGIINTVYAENPPQAAICLGGIIFFIWLYYFLTKIKYKEMIDLLKVVLIIIAIQSVWVLVEVLFIKFQFGVIDKSPHLCGTIGYVNLIALLMASLLPLAILYKKTLIPFFLGALWFCASYGSLGAMATSMWFFLFEKSKRFILLTLVFLAIVGYIGIPKLINDVRPRLWFCILREVKKSPVVGVGLGRFKDNPMCDISDIRCALEKVANEGDEDAKELLTKIPKEEFKHEFRTLDVKAMITPDERAEALIKKVSSKMASGVAFKPHNMFLGLAREAGLVTVIPLIGFIIVTFINFIRSEKTLLQKAIFGALCGFYVGMVFDFPERNLPTISIIVIILAANTMLVKKEAR